MENSIKIKVFIITYNRVHYLKQTIESILNQTYKNFELVVLDNCSTDNTEEYVKSIKDYRIQYIKHPVNLGGIGNISYAFSHCSEKYFAIIHDDDILHSNFLMEEIKCLEKNNLYSVVTCLANNIDGDGKIIKKIKNETEKKTLFSGTDFFETYMYDNKSLTFPSAIYRTEFIKSNNINIKACVGPCADVVIFMDIEKNGGMLCELNKSLIDYRIYSNQDSSINLEKMLIQLMGYLTKDEYYHILLMNNKIYCERYFKWFLRRLFARKASNKISYDDAVNYLKQMSGILQQKKSSNNCYIILLNLIDKTPRLSYNIYKFVKKMKR